MRAARRTARCGPRDRREPTADGGPLIAVVIGTLAIVGITAVGLTSDRNEAQPGDIEVDLADTRFDPDELRVPAGPAAFFVDNRDLFWHTFTIEGTYVDVRVASRGTHRIEVDLEPGTYDLVCTIPGHAAAGMKGVITVK